MTTWSSPEHPAKSDEPVTLLAFRIIPPRGCRDKVATMWRQGNNIVKGQVKAEVEASSRQGSSWCPGRGQGRWPLKPGTARKPSKPRIAR